MLENDAGRVNVILRRVAEKDGESLHRRCDRLRRRLQLVKESGIERKGDVRLADDMLFQTSQTDG